MSRLGNRSLTWTVKVNLMLAVKELNIADHANKERITMMKRTMKKSRRLQVEQLPQLLIKPEEHLRFLFL